MLSLYIISLTLLVAGGLLCYMGIKLYKTAQMIFCGAIGGYIGLVLVNAFNKQEFYILALVLTVIGAFLGYKYYKFSLYVCVSISAFLVTFSYFWKQAVAIANDAARSIVSARLIITENMTEIKSFQGLLDTFDAMRMVSNSNWIEVGRNAGEIVKHGFIVAAAVALVAGILTVWIGDYVIMAASAGLGAVLLVNMIEMFVEVNPITHLLFLVVIGLSGVIVQYAKFKKKRR